MNAAAASLGPALAAQWTHEAVRLHHRYQREVVEACGLCPWAERARVGDAFRARVLLQADARETGPSTAAIESLMGDARAEVAVLIYPRLRLGKLDFERFVASVREADAVRHPLGWIPFVFAAFHPEAAPDTRDAERIIPFLRRTPDPTIQLLRSDVLERVRNGAPQGKQFIDARALSDELAKTAPVPLRKRIAHANFATVERMGVPALAKRLDAIVQDRATTYRALDGASAEHAVLSD